MIVSLFLSPIIGFYLLKDWHLIQSRIFLLTPIHWRTLCIICAKEINNSFAYYFRGQITVCLILSVYYSLLLWFSGLYFGVTIGILTGLLTFIPYFGFFACLTTAFFLSIFQWGGTHHLLMILCIYGGGQLVESILLTPWFIGKHVGIHPIWLLFALFAGGTFKGFSGVLLALPMATFLAACWRLLRKFYLQSTFYKKTTLPWN